MGLSRIRRPPGRCAHSSRLESVPAALPRTPLARRPARGLSRAGALAEGIDVLSDGQGSTIRADFELYPVRSHGSKGPAPAACLPVELKQLIGSLSGDAADYAGAPPVMELVLHRLLGHARVASKAITLAVKEKVDIRLYSIIYDAIEDIQKSLEGLRAPKFQEKIQGRAEVREVINIQKVGVIAGCHVISGIIQRHSSARLIRDSVVVYEGKIDSLRRFKDDVKEVASGFECGISLDKFQDLKRGDIVEPFSVEEVLP